jgi:Mg2+ and Co2+ transporter CorA
MSRYDKGKVYKDLYAYYNSTGYAKIKKNYQPSQKQLLFLQNNTDMSEDQISRLTRNECSVIIEKVIKGAKTKMNF